MVVTKTIVKRNCTYGDVLFILGQEVYVSGPYNFGKRKIFVDGKCMYFGEVDYNDFF